MKGTQPHLRRNLGAIYGTWLGEQLGNSTHRRQSYNNFAHFRVREMWKRLVDTQRHEEEATQTEESRALCRQIQKVETGKAAFHQKFERSFVGSNSRGDERGAPLRGRFLCGMKTDSRYRYNDCQSARFLILVTDSQSPSHRTSMSERHQFHVL